MNNIVEIYAVSLDKELKKDEYDRLMAYVSAERRERIRGFHRFEDAQRTLTGDILVRCILCNRLKKRNEALEFGVNEYGKPYLLNYNGIHFNVSHSGKWVVCCVDTLPVGIDIEIIKPVNMSIAERFFSKEEFKSLKSKNLFEKEAYFYDLWTLKECYIKSVGKGLSIPLDSFTVKVSRDHINIHTENESEYFYFKQYYIDEDYKMAVCTRKNEFPEDVRFINIDNLCEEALSL